MTVDKKTAYTNAQFDEASVKISTLAKAIEKNISGAAWQFADDYRLYTLAGVDTEVAIGISVMIYRIKKTVYLEAYATYSGRSDELNTGFLPADWAILKKTYRDYNGESYFELKMSGPNWMRGKVYIENDYGRKLFVVKDSWNI